MIHFCRIKKLLKSQRGTLMVESALLFPVLIFLCMLLIGFILYFYSEGIDLVRLNLKAIREVGSEPKLWKVPDETGMIRKADLLEQVMK